MGIDVVDELGNRVEELWLRTDYDPRRFPEIAAGALADARLPERLSPDEIIRWALNTPVLPAQPDIEARFGQPPVTLYRARRFYIDALHWIDGSTTIHEHSFSGAFQVLRGSSIETRYGFTVDREIDGHFAFGTLEVKSTTLHARGDIEQIYSGHGGLIHGLFHLERPSITIVVRTERDGSAGPQFNYTRNGIATHPFLADESRDRVLQIVTMLRSIEHPELESIVGDLVARSDVHTAYRVLDVCSSLPDNALFERVVERVSDRTVAERFREAFRETRRLAFLYSRRALVKNTDLRFLLGVLLNARRRRDALKLVAERTSLGAPERQTAAWLRELSNVSIKLQAAGVPWQPNVLGLPAMGDELERALARELRGERADDDERTATDLAKLRALPALSCLFA
jgi:hypothetical protein